MRRHRLGDDRGAVVAEFAVALPAIVLVVLLGAAALATASRQVRIEDAAADAARLAARGEPDRIRGFVEASVPGATVESNERGDIVCVTVRVPGILPLPLAATGCALAGGL